MEVFQQVKVSGKTASCTDVTDVDWYSNASKRNEDRVKETERAFVERKFRKASILANKVLQEHSHYSSGVPTPKLPLVRLQTVPIPSDFAGNQSFIKIDGSFLVDLSSTISPVDRAAVILLQSCYEVYFNRSKTKAIHWDLKGVQTFLNCYCSIRSIPIPLEVCVVWIQFCHGAGITQTSLHMAAELLNVLLLSKSVQAAEQANECRDELVWFLLTKGLPFVKSPNHVEAVLNSTQADAWAPIESTFVMTQRPETESMSVILSQLDGLSKRLGCGSTPIHCISQCKKQLESMLDENGGYQNQAETHSEEDAAMDLDGVVSSRNHSRQLLVSHPDWKTQLSNRMLDLFRTHVIYPLFISEERWTNRSQTAFAAFMAFLAWKRRRRIQSASHSVGKMMMSPIREIVEALLPQRV